MAPLAQPGAVMPRKGKRLREEAKEQEISVEAKRDILRLKELLPRLGAGLAVLGRLSGTPTKHGAIYASVAVAQRLVRLPEVHLSALASA